MRDVTQDYSCLALNTATLGHNMAGMGAGWTPEQTIEACAERGIRGIVFWRREIAGRALEIGRYAHSVGVEVIGLCRAPFLTGPLAFESERAILDDFRYAVEETAELRAPVLTIVTGGIQPGTRGVSRSLADVERLVSDVLPYAEQCDVKLALEPLHPMYGGDRSCLMTTRDALDICDRFRSKHLGIAVDVYHTWWDTDLPRQLARAGDRIFGYHVCDWLSPTEDMLLDRGMMGDGIADLKGIRRDVEAAGYAGFCEVEIFSSRNWWQRRPEEVLDVMIERFQTFC